MKAMVLAAGQGTRLRPLTDERPKALVEIGGRTLLEITLSRLRAFGVREVIINVHHFADMIVEYLKANGNFGMRIEVSREDALLDTGGAALAVSQFTLYGDARGQRRPSLIHAAPPELGKALYEEFVLALRALGVRVETGVFQAHMSLELVNDGPVTILLDSDKTF